MTSLNSPNPENVEYEALSTEIRETIKIQDEMYRDIQGISKDENSQYKLDEKIDDLKLRRNNIFNFLKDKYNSNTVLRKKYFDETYENKLMLQDQDENIKYLKQKIGQTQGDADTHTRKINMEKYDKQKFEYYYNLYIIIICILVLLVFVLLVTKNRILSRSTGKNVVMLILLMLLVYIIYYVYFNNYNRDKFDWDKSYFPEPKSGGMQCQEILSEEDAELEKLEQLASQKIKDFNNLSCKK
jgi:hypothetical protein